MMPDSYKDDMLMPALQRNFKEIESHVAGLELYMNTYATSALDMLTNDIAKERLGTQFMQYYTDGKNLKTVYKQDGTLIRSHLPRYEYVKLAHPIYNDLFDVNKISAYTITPVSNSSWVMGSGILTVTSTVDSYMLRSGMDIKDCCVVTTCTQAEVGSIVARAVGETHSYKLTFGDDSSASPGVQLWKVVAGIATSLAGPFNVTWARDTAKVISLTVQGTTIEVEFDGVSLCSVIDSDLISGSTGICSNSSVASIYNDLKVYAVVKGVWAEEGNFENSLTANQADVETDLTGLWGISNETAHTFERTTDDSWSNDACARIISTYAGTQLMSISTYPTPKTGIVPGNYYMFSVQSKIDVGASGIANGRTIRIDIKWLNASDVEISTSYTTHTASLVWKRYGMVAVAPALASKAYVKLYLIDAQNDEALYWDGAVFDIRDSYDGDFISGYTPVSYVYNNPIMSIPTEYIDFKDTDFSIEFTYTPINQGYSTNPSAYMCVIKKDRDRLYFIKRTVTGQITMGLYNSPTTYSFTSSMAAPLALGNSYNICMSVGVEKIEGFVNGVSIGSTTYTKLTASYTPTEIIISGPYGTFGGSNLSTGAAGVYSNLRISRCARSLKEHHDGYTNGLSLEVDDYTLLKMDFLDTLRATTRSYYTREDGTFVVADFYTTKDISQATHIGGDSAIFQAVSELPSTGGTVYILDGTYNILNTIHLKSNNTIRMNASTKLVLADPIRLLDFAVFTNDDHDNGNANIIISGGTINGVPVDDSTIDRAVWLDKVSNSYIMDTSMIGFTGYGVLLDDCTNIQISNNSISRCAHGIMYNNSTSCRFVNNTIQYCNESGIYSVSLSPNTGTVISGNTIYSCGSMLSNVIYGNGINVCGNSNTITGNTVIRSGRHGILVDQGDSNLIVGNTVSDSNQTDNNGSQIYVDQGDYNMIQNNTCRKSTRVTIPVFTRATIAYDFNGVQSISGAERYSAVGDYGNGILIEEGTTNLLTANQSSVETDLTGLSMLGDEAAKGTLTRNTVQKWSGNACAKVDMNTEMSVGDDVCMGTPAGAGGIAVSGGTAYVFSVYIKSSEGTTDDAKLRIVEYNSAGVAIADTLSPFLVTTSADFSRHELSVTTQTTTAYMSVRVSFYYYDMFSDCSTFYIDGLQLEQKTMATSWQIGGTARNNEELELPTTGFTKGSWSIDTVLEIQHRQAHSGYVWYIYIDASNHYACYITSTGGLVLRVRNAGTNYYISKSLNLAYGDGEVHHITCTGNGSRLRLYCDGVQVGVDTAYTEPAAALPATMMVGSDYVGSTSANSIITGFRISNSVRTAEDILERYTNAWLPTLDEYTTYWTMLTELSASLWSGLYGVVISAGSTGNYITNNDLYTSGETGSISDAGTGTITAAGNRL